MNAAATLLHMSSLQANTVVRAADLALPSMNPRDRALLRRARELIEETSGDIIRLAKRALEMSRGSRLDREALQTLLVLLSTQSSLIHAAIEVRPNRPEPSASLRTRSEHHLEQLDDVMETISMGLNARFRSTLTSQFERASRSRRPRAVPRRA